jgi:hypothetical protein
MHALCQCCPILPFTFCRYGATVLHVPVQVYACTALWSRSRGARFLFYCRKARDVAVVFHLNTRKCVHPIRYVYSIHYVLGLPATRKQQDKEEAGYADVFCLLLNLLLNLHNS